MPDPNPLFRILIVEDEYAIADDLARTLRQEGLTPLPPVADAAAAVAALDAADVDFAILDINLDGTISFEVAAELRRRAVPFLFITGYEASVVPPEFGDVTIVQKPHDSDRIVAEVKRARAAALTTP